MPSRRRTLLLAASAASLLAGCSSERSGTTAEPTTDHPYSVDDLTVSNWSDREREVAVTVEPAASEREPFADRMTLSPKDSGDSKAVYPDLEEMDGPATVHVEVADLGADSYEWGGDAGDDHRGLTVLVRSDEIEFHEKVA